MTLLSAHDLLMGRDTANPLTPELRSNLNKLLLALNKLAAKCPIKLTVTSGYRPAAINAAVGGAKKSNHMICLACDFADVDGKLDQWCLDNPKVLEECGLYQESPASSVGWTHLQAVLPKSGKRVFIP